MEARTDPPSPKRVAVYLHTLYNGGVERVMFNLIQGFLDRGVAVDLALDFLVYSPFEKLLPPVQNMWIGGGATAFGAEMAAIRLGAF